MGSRAVKLCRVVKPLPSVLTANTVPLPEVPPSIVVPYNLLLTKSSEAVGFEPSLLVKKPERLVAVALNEYKVLRTCDDA